MNELQIFNNPKFGEIRTITEDGKMLFCGKDVAKALGYKNTSKALSDHCKGVTKRYVGVRTGTKADGTPAEQQVKMSFIPKGDVFRLAAKSELPGAEEFESWIFDEVLPSIFECGGYMTPEAERQLTEELTAVTAMVQSLAKGYESQVALTQSMVNLVENLTRRVEKLERGQDKRTLLQKTASGENPFEDAPVAIKPPTNKVRRQWMRTASEKLNMLADKCGLPSTTILHNLYQEMEEEQNVILSEVRLNALEQYQLNDCSILLAIFYDKPLRRWFVNRVEHYLASDAPAW